MIRADYRDAPAASDEDLLDGLDEVPGLVRRYARAWGNDLVMRVERGGDDRRWRADAHAIGWPDCIRARGVGGSFAEAVYALGAAIRDDLAAIEREAANEEVA